MQPVVIFRTLGVLFVLFSTTLLLPLGASFLYADGNASAFIESFFGALLVGLALWLPTRRRHAAIRNREGFVIVALMWTAMSALGALPFMLSLDMGFVDALFEAASGYTTTGSTVIVGLDDLPKSILLYRQEIQWLGGIGVIVFAIALLPMLGVGGMQLYKAETPGPFKDERMTPRVARTAKNICLIYFAFTIACTLAFWFAGMDMFDAISHSFSTLSTGGYSTHDASIAYYDSRPIEAVAVLFMLIGATSFNVHYIAWRSLRLGHYAQDLQLRTFLIVVGLLSAVVAMLLYGTGEAADAADAAWTSVFEVVSVVTSTGFGIADFSVWPLALPVLLIFSSFFGGCAGSTAGGIKVVRFMIVGKQALAHLRRLIHPQSVNPVRLGDRVVEPSIIDSVWGFFTIYVIVFAVIMIGLTLDGMDQVSAFGAVAATLNNLGPGLGNVSVTFTDIGQASKVLLVVAMIAGRLEIFTLLVLLTPAFWRR